MPIRVLLIDDHPVVRRGLRAVLEAESDLEVVGEADGGGDNLREAGFYQDCGRLGSAGEGDVLGIGDEGDVAGASGFNCGDAGDLGGGVAVEGAPEMVG